MSVPRGPVGTVVCQGRNLKAAKTRLNRRSLTYLLHFFKGRFARKDDQFLRTHQTGSLKWYSIHLRQPQSHDSSTLIGRQ